MILENQYGRPWDMQTTPDRKRVLLLIGQAQADVTIADLNADKTLRNLKRLTLEDSNEAPFAWLPDSETVIFMSNRNGRNGIYRQHICSLEAQQIVIGPESKVAPRVSADGRWVVYRVLPQPRPKHPDRY